MFVTTATMVAMLLLYALPGFLLIKSKLVKADVIPGFAKLLLYVCQPALTFYSFDKADFSPSVLLNMGVIFIISLVGQLGILMLFYFFIRKKSAENVSLRIFNIAVILANCGFFGVPVAEKLFPDRSDAALYCMVFSFALNLISWTVVMAVVTRDKKYIKPRQVFLNPATVSFFIAFLLFAFSLKLPSLLFEAVSVVGKFATPLCMLILGMRLGTTKFKVVFGSPMQYLAVAIKQLAVPFAMLLLLLLLPVDDFIKQLSFVLFACPVASNVLNFAELCGEGQETAAGTVLLGTILSVVTMPLMMLLIG